MLIILATSSTVWATQEAAEQFKGAKMKIESLNFLEVVRHFESLPVAEIVRIYGAIGEFRHIWISGMQLNPLRITYAGLY